MYLSVGSAKVVARNPMLLAPILCLVDGAIAGNAQQCACDSLGEASLFVLADPSYMRRGTCETFIINPDYSRP